MSNGSRRPAFYALAPSGWRDYLTLLHPPYTLWHLSYPVLGACLAPRFSSARLGLVVGAFALAVGIGAHALDELHGRPLTTTLPPRLPAPPAAPTTTAAAAGGNSAFADSPCLLLFVAAA